MVTEPVMAQDFQTGNGLKTGHGIIIETDVIVGKHVKLGHRVILKSGTRIGDHVRIGDGTIIGTNGFQIDRSSIPFRRVEHKGKVIIENFVDIGSACTVDKGLGVDDVTSIGFNSKIANQVQLSHNVQIGQNVLIVDQTIIARSIIGDGAFISMNSSVRPGIKIGQNAFIGMRAVVVRDVLDGETVYGNPASKRTTKPRKIPLLSPALERLSAESDESPHSPVNKDLSAKVEQLTQEETT